MHAKIKYTKNRKTNSSWAPTKRKKFLKLTNLLFLTNILRSAQVAPESVYNQQAVPANFAEIGEANPQMWFLRQQ